MSDNPSANDVIDETEEGQAKQRLALEVKIDSPSACERHLTVTIPADDVRRYFDEAFGELMPSASVPGFRAGRAPRRLVEQRFRKDVASQVKGSLLMDSMAQITDEQKLSAISEPKLDVTAVEVPAEGPMTFEFDLEVRPDFDLPNWKGLTVERPTREFSSEDVDRQLHNLLARRGRLIPHDGAATAGDYIAAKLTFKNGDEVISQSDEEVICIRPTLSFRDGNIEGFDKLMEGVKAGETRQTVTKLSDETANDALRGKDITAIFEVLEVKKLELPELTPEFLQEIGGFDSEGDLRDALKEDLQRQLVYHQQRRVREQVTGLLIASANWELPPDLLRRQARRELERAVLELRRSGFNENDIRTHENELRQNSLATTARALKEHFILERIAEEENITDEESDYEQEVRLIAAQSGESPRRVRAQLEKGDLMDVLRNQIIERKAIELVLQHAKFVEVPFQPESSDTEAMDQSAGGEANESSIPTAQPDNESESLPG